jgi:hypothetical protein
MLETILRLYTMSMATGVTSPLPHLFGPPGCGKSTSVKQAADLIGVTMHTINVSRISPLELEGVQMPVTTAEEMKLRLLHATFWTSLKEGDILLLDEFLRGFPEVYNGLLDILTAREVGGLQLPKVFIIAASNSVIAYDKALEDRLLHLPVADPRKSKAERSNIADMLVDAIGLLPEMVGTPEMETLIHEEVLPMYDLLDHLKRRSAPPVQNGMSVRNLIGQAKLRQVVSPHLRELIDMNNIQAVNQGKLQYAIFLPKKSLPGENKYLAKAEALLASNKLTDLQRLNTQMNIELLQMEQLTHPSTGGSP